MHEFETLDLDGPAAVLAAEPDTALEPIEYIDGWAVVHRDPATGMLTLMLDDPPFMHVREVMPVDRLIAENRAIAAETAGTRHGDGMSLVARVPMHIWANRLAEPMRQGDTKWLDAWLGNPDHQAFRIRKA